MSPMSAEGRVEVDAGVEIGAVREVDAVTDGVVMEVDALIGVERSGVVGDVAVVDESDGGLTTDVVLEDV